MTRFPVTTIYGCARDAECWLGMLRSTYSVLCVLVKEQYAIFGLNLTLHGLHDMQFSVFEHHSLEELKIMNCDGLTSVAGLGKCRKLSSLTIANCNSLASVACLQECHSLKELKIINCVGLTSVTGLQKCPSLEILTILGCGDLVSVNNRSATLIQSPF